MLTLKDLLGKTSDEIRALGAPLADLTRLRDEARTNAHTLVTRADGADLSGDDASAFDELAQLVERLNEIVGELQQRHDRALSMVRDAGRGSGGYVLERGSAGDGDYDRDAIREPGSIEDYKHRAGSNPWDLSQIRTYGQSPDEVATEMRGRALSAVERMQGTSDRVREAATAILERFDDKAGTLARQTLATSSPAYLRAWSKMSRGHDNMLTDDERRAVEHVRAMSLNDSAGGFLVPFQLDPTIILASNGSRNDIRQFARQVVATGDAWHGVSGNAVSWSWDDEAEEVSDDSPTLTQPTIPVHKASGFVPISIEAIADAPNATEEVAKLLAAGKDDLEAAAFVTGTGVKQPKGIVTALAGTAAVMLPKTAESFSLADVHAMRGAVPARHRKNAAWLANDLTYSTIRQFDTSGGAGLWEFLKEDRPDRLLGKPVGEAEAMDAVINPAATEANHIMVFGDFQHYVVADRLGMSVEFLPHLFGANRRPTGQRGWYAYYRTGADVVTNGAFKMLNVATTA